MKPKKEWSALIVDDQPQNILVVTELLREMKLGGKIYSAPNGKVALDLVKKYRPDIILTDWEMPEMDGLQLVQALKADPETKDIPVIMITGVMTNPESMKSAFEKGVHDFLNKPFNELEFAARVRNTLNLQNALLDLKTSRDQEIEKSRQLEQANEEILETNLKLNHFAYIVSHDLKAPLRGLRSTVGFILDDLKEKKYDEMSTYADLMSSSVQRMDNLIEGILSYSKAGRDIRCDEPVDLRKLLGEVLENVNPPPGMTVVLPEKLPKLKINPVKITQVFQNLIGNAIKYHDRNKGTIVVKCFDSKDYWQFEVEDDGPGIPERFHSKVFKMFQTLKSKGKSGGSGIGLAIVDKIVKESGGEIKVISDGIRGTRMVFNISK